MTITETDLTAADVAGDLEPLVDGRGGAGVDALLDEADAKARGSRRTAGVSPSSTPAGWPSSCGARRDRRLVGRAEPYAGLRFAVDTADPANGALIAKGRGASHRDRTSSCSSSSSGPRSTTTKVDALLADERLAFCRHHLASARRYRPHLLSEPEEVILTEKSVTASSAWVRLFAEPPRRSRSTSTATTVIARSRASRCSVARPRGAAQPRPRRSPRRSSRACAPARSSSTRCSPTRPSTTACASYPTWIASGTCQRGERRVGAGAGRRGAGPLRHPAALVPLKAQLLGLDQLADYDRMASVAAVDARVRLDEARTSCSTPTRRSRPSSPTVARRFFDESWIDAPVRPGKRPGAFCAYTVPIAPPVPAAQLDRRAGATCSRSPTSSATACTRTSPASRAIFHQTTPLTLAETASVFGETVTFGRLLEATTDPDGAARAARGEPRGPDRDGVPPDRDEPLRGPRAQPAVATRASCRSTQFDELWADTQTAMLGDSVEITDGLPHVVVVHPALHRHARIRLRVRVRAAARAVGVPRYEQQGDDFVPRYLELLAAGGSRSPEELGAIVGSTSPIPGSGTAGSTSSRSSSRRPKPRPRRRVGSDVARLT